ncbi:MAG TPA: PQQ-binding-like beta-propeller repeat protein [Planctomycetota bacterium]|nr:PQQ-binding-like beta-propeller repeat protein [Planctomycetota bacterium]
MRRTALTFVLAAAGALTVRAGDWPMFGGRADRNMTSAERGLPVSWSAQPKKNIKWTADLGTQTYSNPVVAGGRVFVGTNNERPRNPAIQGDRGVLMAFAAADGAFLWQASHEKLPGGEKEDWPKIGICSTPCVAGDRVYYVSNRAELVCADVEGFADGENDGPYASERATGPHDADFVWILDMKRDLGVAPNQASASSPVVVDGLVFVVTGHSADHETRTVKNPKAPSFIAVEAATGKLVWQDASPGDRIMEAQWGSPAYGVVDGRPQVAFPGGDGWLYAFEPRSGKLLWKFDCKAHEKRGPDGKPETDNTLIATPVYAGDRVLIAVGRDTDTSGPPGCLRAIDARRSGDVTGTAELWRLAGEDFGRSLSMAAVHDGLVYAVEQDGFLNCLELETGRRVWKHDLLSTVWGSPLVADGKVYLRNGDGDVLVLAAGREKKVLARNTLPKCGHGSVTAAGGTLYVAGDSVLYAIAAER